MWHRRAFESFFPARTISVALFLSPCCGGNVSKLSVFPRFNPELVGLRGGERGDSKRRKRRIETRCTRLELGPLEGEWRQDDDDEGLDGGHGRAGARRRDKAAAQRRRQAGPTFRGRDPAALRRGEEGFPFAAQPPRAARPYQDLRSVPILPIPRSICN